jgi:hypothetical protein
MPVPVSLVTLTPGLGRHPRDAEIRDHCMAAVNENVFRLDVAADDAKTVRV